MKVERVIDSVYRVHLHPQELIRLEMVAKAFHGGNKASALNDIITDGFSIATAVKELLEDKGHQEEIAQRYCETQREKVDRIWKDKKDASQGGNEG